MTSLCVITDDPELLCELIDWLDMHANNPDFPTTICVFDFNVQEALEILKNKARVKTAGDTP